MKYVRANVKFIDLGEEEILSCISGCEGFCGPQTPSGGQSGGSGQGGGQTGGQIAGGGFFPFIFGCPWGFYFRRG